MRGFEASFMRTLRQIYDTEKQLAVSLEALCVAELDESLTELIGKIADQSRDQAKRLEHFFSVLYLAPKAEVSWPATALIREAWNAVTEYDDGPSAEGCAAALLSLKRYELSLYESLYRWSSRCALDEVLPGLRRSIAEELLNSAALAQIAFGVAHTPAPPEVHFH